MGLLYPTKSIRKSQLPDGLFLQVCDYTRLRSIRKSQHQCSSFGHNY